MAVMMSFHTEKCFHLVSEHTALRWLTYVLFVVV